MENISPKLFKLSQYLFIVCKFWKSNCWISFSYYILHTWKNSRKSKINSYAINQMSKFQVFVIQNYV